MVTVWNCELVCIACCLVKLSAYHTDIRCCCQMDTRTQVDGQDTNNLGGKGLVRMTFDVPQARSQRRHKSGYLAVDLCCPLGDFSELAQKIECHPNRFLFLDTRSPWQRLCCILDRH